MCTCFVVLGSPLGIVGLTSPHERDGIPGMPVLPPIGQSHGKLTTIGEASREHTQAFSLPMPQADGNQLVI